MILQHLPILKVKVFWNPQKSFFIGIDGQHFELFK